MKYTVRTIQKYRIAYGLLPYKRNQDVIRVHDLDGGHYVLAVADGWGNLEFLPTDQPGMEVAKFVAREYPKQFLYSIRGMDGRTISSIDSLFWLHKAILRLRSI